MLSVESIYNSIVQNIEQNNPIAMEIPKKITVKLPQEETFENILKERIVGGKADYSNLSKEEISEKIEAAMRRAAGKYGMDYELIKAVVKAESSFKSDTVSHAGAQGLMQLMPGTAA